VAHPNGGFQWYVCEQFVFTTDNAGGSTEFSAITRRNFATLRLTGQLHAVANAQNRDPEFKDFRINLWRRFAVNTGRTAGQNDALGFQFLNPPGGKVVSNQLAKHILFANPPRDELGGLASKIENQNKVFGSFSLL
jgi:hypothetical protein